MLSRMAISVQVYGFIIKTFMCLAPTFVTNFQWLSALECFLATALVWLYFKWQPYLYDAMNHARVAIYGAVCYTTVCYVILQLIPNTDPVLVTRAMWCGLIPVMVAGYVASYYRMSYRKRVLRLFEAATLDTDLKSIYQFSDAREVEALSRCCRKWIDKNKEIVDVDAMVSLFASRNWASN